jgi:NADH-quinone oxidoreductase subunit J
MIETLLSAEFYQIMLFYVYSFILVGAALAVVTMRNTVYSALFLILSFFSAAALWMLLEAEFLALTLVLVYVGAVMVLFLFVIMMLDVKIKPRANLGMSNYTKIGIFVALIMAVEMIMLMAKKLLPVLPQDDLVKHVQGHSNVKQVAETLYTQYVLPFEVASVILLVAIVAAILLTLRRRDDYKHVNPESQVHVKADKGRMRIVKMKTQKGNDIGGDS